MIRFFRSSYAAQYIVLLLIVVLLYLPAWLQNIGAPAKTALSPLSALVPYLITHFPYVAIGLGVLLILVLSFFVNGILSNNQLSTRVGLMGAFVFVCVAVVIFASHSGSAVYLLALLFVLATLHTLLRLHDASESYFLLFNAGLFVSLASLFVFPFALLLFWIWIGLFISRSLQMRALIITIVGFITPYFFLLSAYFMTDQLVQQFEAHIAFYESFSFTRTEPSIISWIKIFLVFLLFILSLRHVLTQSAEKKLSTRKKIRIVSWLYAFSIILLALGHNQQTAAALFSIPLTTYIAFYLSHAKKLFFPQLLVWLLILLSFTDSIISFLF